ncbi:hypothetical protein LOZ61_001368 [Ophidiomyces ophidiicola]|uniref:Uncharacterized protein n=1 Tax=Ophidiomyces ophidiicola TaxID=1387563 RepID=A0ACB8V5M7_9EURO|nr:hypothetical protein LOZ61_001368 [Ophidiomyces ophidiicola]KAI1930541.1 hypothetical protein LOZ60_000772 [Ophidiomyces ophidiicola]KAI2131909.1 hypothetical protein LOZ31_000276 [Ophidiomyces ophidiicola]KAI2148072.1 hypothetical protein LOZ27_002102 [Ophidiomyces ophidiicola]KAI2198836.1 hypothetical protein LOZ20_002156 [Ophidiomyces ophidiicola]
MRVNAGFAPKKDLKAQECPLLVNKYKLVARVICLYQAMCKYTAFRYTHRTCRAQPKHMMEDRARVDHFPGGVDDHGVPIPDPCPNPKTGNGQRRMCAEATQSGEMAFGSSSNLGGPDVLCLACVRQGLI